MSVKKAHLYNMAWRVLLEACSEKGQPLTAGEFAKRLGVARSTAVRWLTDMVEEGAIYSFRFTGKNGLSKSVYEPIGRGETWFYARGGYFGDG